jgi:hypothetical protein
MAKKPVEPTTAAAPTAEPDYEVDLTVEEVRQALDDGSDIDELMSALDSAQGSVHTGEKESATVLVTIKKEA